MTSAGWWIMSISVGLVVLIFLYCIWLALTVPHSEETLHGFEGNVPDPEENEAPGSQESPPPAKL